MKQCTKCNKEKDLSEFSFKNKKLSILSSQCKDCHKEYSKFHYENNKQSYIKKAVDRNKNIHVEYKLLTDEIKSVGCKYCPEKDICCLDFHHINDDKEYNISTMISSGYSKETLLKEIAKCEVVCANCHRKIHKSLRRESNSQ